MTSLLDHSETVAQSGKHGQYRVHATAKLFCLTNPKWPFNTVDAILGQEAKLDKAFLSRLVIYFQPKAHVEFLQSRRAFVRAKGEKAYPTFNPQLIEVIDYLNSFVVELSADQVDWAMNLKHQYNDAIPSGTTDIYYPRYDHHILCILDGIVKYNTIVEGRTSFKITQKDMDETEEIISFILSTWTPDAPPLFANYNVRKTFLPISAQQVLEAIEKSPGPISEEEIEYAAKLPPKKWLGVLVKNKLVSTVERDGKNIYTKYSEFAFKDESENKTVQTKFVNEIKLEETR
jgi:hypothetical protein